MANEIFSQQVLQFLDYSLHNIDLSMIQASESADEFRPYFESPLNQLSLFDSYLISQKIKEHMITNPLIDSIYLYRAADHRLLSQAWSGNLDDYPDHAFIETALEQRTPFRWTPQRGFVEFPEVEKERQVLSLVRKMGDEGLVVVNLSPVALKLLLEERFSKGMKENTFTLFDQQGQQLLALNNPELDGEQGEGASLSTAHSAYSGLEIRSRVKHMEIFNVVTSVSLIWLLIIVGALLAGVLWIVYVTRRNYRPVQSIVGRIEAFSEWSEEGTHSKDEFNYIDKALEKLMYSFRSHQKEQEENRHFKRQILHEELLEGGRVIVEEEWQREVEALGMDSQFEKLAVVLIEMDNYAHFSDHYSHRDQDLLKYAIRSVVHEHAETQSLRIWTEWLEPHRLSGIFLLNGDEEERRGDMTRLAELVRDWVEHHLPYTVTISLGDTVKHIGGLTISYIEAVNALKYKLALGRNRVIPSWDVSVEQPVEMLKHLQMIRSIVQSYRLGESKWESELASFFELLRTSGFHKEDIAGLLYHFNFNLYSSLMELSKEYQTLWLEHMLPQMHEILTRLDDLQELQRQIHSVLKKALSDMHELRESRRQHGVSTKICNYIDEHYMNPDLSLTHLSEAFSYHANYLSKVFKEEIGERFVDYLARVRIKHAKQLLATTSHTVQEVAVSVGYTHTFSFMRVFKKQVGTPPGEYRKEMV